MSCEICLLDSTTDTVMWTCVGCSREFHPACVGVVIQRGSLRRKEKRIDPQAYVLPCCSACQTLISVNIDVRSLTEQQAKLAEVINSNTEVTHRANKHSDVYDEVIDRLESLLNDIKKELTASKGGSYSGNEDVSIKNHLTSLFDISMKASKDNIAAYVEALTSDMTKELKGIYADFEKVSSLTIEMANHCSEHNSQPAPVSDIMEELKTLSNAVNSLAFSPPPASPPPPPPPVPLPRRLPPSSLHDELIDLGAPHNRKVAVRTVDVAVQSSPEPTAGWRILGSKKVWRSDWTEYDLRKRTRELQQKLKEKANKRKKAAKRRNNNNKNDRSTRETQSSNQHNNNNSNNNSSNENKNKDNSSKKSHSSSNLWSRNHPPNCNNVSGYQGINYSSSSSKMTQHSIGSSLPLDKDLLAAAKQQFSRPPGNSGPPPNKRGIKFQPGEILNPYPTAKQSPQKNSTTVSPTFGPTLRTSFTNNCTPCSCQHSGF